MKRDNRQILVNPHSSQEKVPAGVLNLGEIGVQHNNVKDAALYVETDADSESANTVAKFITEEAINERIENAMDLLQPQIDSLNEEIGLPHDPEQWNSGLSVWQAIEQTYEEMTAGTAAASTKLFIDEAEGHDEKYLKLRSVLDEASSAVNYYIKSEGIGEAIDSAYTIVNEKVEALSSATVEEIGKVNEKVDELSAATKDVLESLDFAGVTQEGKPVVNVTQEDGLINAEAGNISAEFVEINDSGDTLDEALDYILENIEANKIESEDGSIVVTPSLEGTTVKVNLDEATIVLNDNNELVADLKLSAITPSSVNVREEFALIDHLGRQLGDTVKVYKDSSLYGVFLGHVDDTLSDPTDPESLVSGSGDTALDLIYHKEDGTYELVAIDVNDFLEESEFKDGLVVDNHVVKVKVDESSEKVVINESGDTAPVLSVSDKGVKIANIQAAINEAVRNLAGSIDADVTGTSTDGHVTVEVVQENTKLASVVVSTDDIASEEELDTVEESVGLNEDGTFTPDSGSTFASAATSVRNEIQLIDQALKEVAEKLNAAAVEKGGESVENLVKLDVTDDGEGLTAVTINDADLKQAIDFIHDDITTEIAAREEADAEVVDEIIGTSGDTTSANTIWGIKNLIAEITTSVVKDINVPTGETLLDVTKEDTLEGDIYTISSTDKLNDAVELAESSVQEIGFASVETKDTSDYGSNAGAEIVAADDGGSKINIDLSALKVDCGEY